MDFIITNIDIWHIQKKKTSRVFFTGDFIILFTAGSVLQNECEVLFLCISSWIKTNKTIVNVYVYIMRFSVCCQISAPQANAAGLGPITRPIWKTSRNNTIILPWRKSDNYIIILTFRCFPLWICSISLVWWKIWVKFYLSNYDKKHITSLNIVT